MLLFVEKDLSGQKTRVAHVPKPSTGAPSAAENLPEILNDEDMDIEPDQGTILCVKLPKCFWQLSV